MGFFNVISPPMLLGVFDGAQQILEM